MQPVIENFRSYVSLASVDFQPVYHKFSELTQIAMKIFAAAREHLPKTIPLALKKISISHVFATLIPLAGIAFVIFQFKSRQNTVQTNIHVEPKRSLPPLPASPESSPLLEGSSRTLEEKETMTHLDLRL